MKSDRFVVGVNAVVVAGMAFVMTIQARRIDELNDRLREVESSVTLHDRIRYQGDEQIRQRLNVLERER
jgi:hypothetical protein